MMQLRRRTFFAAVVLALVVGTAVGVYSSTRAELRRPLLEAQAPVTPIPVIPVQMPQGATFSSVAEAIRPAVINITVSRAGGGRTPIEEFFGDDAMRRFFGDAPERIPQRSLGSGVIVDPTGIALTNAHVVERAAEDKAAAIEIVTLDGGKHRAKIIGLDKKTDLAVLKLDDGKATFKYARLGDSDRMQIGDWVLAVGSPFGLQATVTAGIISAKARQLEQGPFDDFLQTDAAINPGNSGGPLVNMQGEVIGINTAIVAGGTGIGFAIPSNMARKIYTDLRDKGRVTRGWLGVSIQPLTPELARSFGSKDAKGVLINEVMADSPAARAGLKPGDILLEFEGRSMEGPGDLQRAVGLFSPERSAKVKILRDQTEKTVEIKVGQAPDERQAQQQQPPRPGGGKARTMLGLDVRPVTPEIARQMNLRTTDGVIVVRVDDGTPAAEAGVQRGDVVKQLNGQNVKTMADFERLTQGMKEGDPLTVLLQRGAMSLYVAFRVGRG
jgi:serine protease Do